MMCFAGCEEKGDEIDNTTDTGESVEINEANLVGTWKIVSCAEKFDEKWYDSTYYYEDHYESYDEEPNKGPSTETVEMPLWTYAFTIKADKTYEFEEERVIKDYDGYSKDYCQEHGTWSLKGKNFVIQWIEGCWKEVDGINENEDYRTKPYEETYCNTFEEFLDYLKAGGKRDFCYFGYFNDYYEFERLDIVEKGYEFSISIIKLTSTELVIQAKGFVQEGDEWVEEIMTTYFKRVK